MTRTTTAERSRASVTSARSTACELHISDVRVDVSVYVSARASRATSASSGSRPDTCTVACRASACSAAKGTTAKTASATCRGSPGSRAACGPVACGPVACSPVACAAPQGTRSVRTSGMSASYITISSSPTGLTATVASGLSGAPIEKRMADSRKLPVASVTPSSRVSQTPTRSTPSGLRTTALWMTVPTKFCTASATHTAASALPRAVKA